MRLPRSSFHHRYRNIVSCIGFSLLAACSALPDSGPTERQFQKGQRDAQAQGFNFSILTLTLPALEAIRSVPKILVSQAPLDTQRRSNDLIGPGDALLISIYEIGNSLFSGTAANASGTSSVGMMAGGLSGSAGGTASTLMSGGGMDSRIGQGSGAATLSSLPPVTVDNDGNIYLAFIGRLHVAGQNKEQIGALIKERLARKSQYPDVMVRMAQDLNNLAIIYGDVKISGKISLTSHHERLLDAIATAQGTVHPIHDEVIILTRGGIDYTLPLVEIGSNDQDNVELRPADSIRVMYQPLSFTVFGAAEKVSEVMFQQPSLTLAEALSRSQGLADYRADPNAVYLMRYENNVVLRKLGQPVSATGPTTPIVYKFDMMNPTSYFMAQRFEMKDKDLIYIANSRSNKFFKLFGLFSTVVQPGISAGYMAK